MKATLSALTNNPTLNISLIKDKPNMNKNLVIGKTIYPNERPSYNEWISQIYNRNK